MHNKLTIVSKNPRKILDYFLKRGARFIKDDKLFLSLRWWCCMRSKLDWEHPRTFSEKLQWLKLYDRQPLYTTLVDKVKVKEYVAKIIGEEYIIPTLGVWERAEDIDFDSLPNKFVLKCNHNSGGGMCICTDKSKLDIEKVRKDLNCGLKQNYYLQGREWPYKDVPKRILAEQFLEEKPVSGRPAEAQALTDYKFYCFGGEPIYCQVIRDRHTKETIDFYDMEWNHMPFYGLIPVAKNGLIPVAKPAHLNKMAEICRRLSHDMTFARVDLYVISDKEYFGEVTLYPASGFGTFTPEEWNTHLGDLINLRGISWGGYNVLAEDDMLNISEWRNGDNELCDYKFYCFHGNPKYILVVQGRCQGDKRFDYFDVDWNHLPVCDEGVRNADEIPACPSHLKEMLEIAKKLSANIPHVRIDLYCVNNRIYFGEITFYDANGFAKYNPAEYDYIFGSYLKLGYK